MTDENLPPTPPPAPEPAAPTAPPAYAAPTAPPAYAAPTAPPAYAPPAYAAPAYGNPVAAPKKTLSLIGMIAGIVGLVGFAIVFLPIVGSILQLFIPGAALVLGILGRKREGAPARGFWITAIITGIVGLAIAIIALIGWIALFAVGSANGAFNGSNY